MAIDDQHRPIIVQFTQVLRDRSHRNQPCALDAANRVLFRLPNVYQAQRLAVFKAAFYLARTDLQGNFGHDQMLAIDKKAKRAPQIVCTRLPSSRGVRLTPLLYSGVKSSVSNRFYSR